MIYEFKPRNILSTLIKKFATIDSVDFERFRYQKKTIDVTSYVTIKAKIVYNFRHTFLILKLSDKIFLRFYKNYVLFNKSNKKLFN